MQQSSNSWVEQCFNKIKFASYMSIVSVTIEIFIALTKGGIGGRI